MHNEDISNYVSTTFVAIFNSMKPNEQVQFIQNLVYDKPFYILKVLRHLPRAKKVFRARVQYCKAVVKLNSILCRYGQDIQQLVPEFLRECNVAHTQLHTISRQRLWSDSENYQERVSELRESERGVHNEDQGREETQPGVQGFGRASEEFQYGFGEFGEESEDQGDRSVSVREL